MIAAIQPMKKSRRDEKSERERCIARPREPLSRKFLIALEFRNGPPRVEGTFTAMSSTLAVHQAEATFPGYTAVEIARGDGPIEAVVKCIRCGVVKSQGDKFRVRQDGSAECGECRA